ncbi:MAG: DUF2703 domain-containing protein [Deltaproteobacteria bacterium]|nr:DUF2703 domain-containing protein [Deltaproteobacteria bacterium]PWB63211.1 MAG: hypothetical protein C3F14_08665 [Deltaproteobacteria bacterium]
MNKTLKMVVLYNEGCPATPKTIQLIEECISEYGFHVELRKILVSSQEEANEWKFLGSPTVQINGIDIDPAVRDAKVFGFM